MNFAITMINNTICLKRKTDDTIKWLDIEIPPKTMNNSVIEYINNKILNFLKPMFYMMPFEKIEVNISQEALDRLGQFLNNYNAILNNTNSISKQIKDLKKKTTNFKNILFFSTDGNTFYSEFAEKAVKKTKAFFFQENFQTGFNTEKRRWEDTDLPFSIPVFIDYIFENKIKTIYSINQYLLETYMRKTGVYLLSCFDMMDVEYICIDGDARDADLAKQFFSNNSFRRYSLAFLESRFWDKYYGVTNVLYPTVPQVSYNMDAEFKELKEDYNIVVLSFSRLNDILPRLGQCLYVLEHFDEKELFSQFQLWHHAMLFCIKEMFNCSEFELLRNYRDLCDFGHVITQLLKFEVIEGLKTDRKIEIYGDSYWQLVFPDYYKGWLGNKEQIDDLFNKNESLHLLLNWAPTIFNSNPHLYSAILRKNPFTCYAPLAKTDEFKGFEHVEYNNIDTLNYIVENAQDIFKKPDFLQAIKNQQKLMETSGKFFENSIISNPDNQYQHEFEKVCNKTSSLIDKKVYRYIDDNEAMLRQTYTFLFKDPKPIDISKSKFFNRKYIQRIRKITAEDLKLK